MARDPSAITWRRTTRSIPRSSASFAVNWSRIDLAAYAANKRLLSATLGAVDAERFQRLASAAALALTRWVVAAFAMTEGNDAPSREQVAGLAHLRTAYDELAGAHDAMRRMVERGYITYRAPAQG